MIDGLKPYLAMKDSGVPWLGDVPEHWELRRLKGAVDPGRPITYGIVQCGENVADGVPYIRPVDMREDGTVLLERLKRTSKEIAASYRRSEVRGGDVVISIGPSFGKVMIVPNELAGANLTQGTARLAPDSSISAEFLHWQMRSKVIHQSLAAVTTGSTFLALNLEPLASTRVLLPPLPEQAAIVRFLDHADRRIRRVIRAKQKLIKLLEEQKQAIIHRAVTRGLDPNIRLKPSGVPWLGDVPEGWQVLQLRRLVRRGRRITYGIVQPGDLDPSGRFMVRGQDYSFGWAAPEKLFRVSDAIEVPYKRSRLLAGDLVLTIVGSVGNVAIVPEWLDGANITQTTARVSLDPEKADAEFVAAELRGPVGRRSVELYVKGAAQPGLNLEHVRVFLLPIPSLEEQRRIAAFIDVETRPLQTTTTRAVREIELLREYRTRLIADVVTGKLDVRTVAASLPDAVGVEPDALEESDADEADADAETEEESIGEEVVS